MEVVIIVAGGSGSRMQSTVPKQFLEIGGRPILMHTIDAFHQYSDEIKIIVVLPGDHINQWQLLIDRYSFPILHEVATGGTSRTESVRNGLELVKNDDIVAIHDGVRPLISKNVISRAFQSANVHGNAVVVVQLKESLRRQNSDNTSEAVDRSNFRLVQTPQVFKADIIKKAYENIRSQNQEFTDDASVAEHNGISIVLVEGDYANIKITTPEDLVLADSIIRNRK